MFEYFSSGLGFRTEFAINIYMVVCQVDCNKAKLVVDQCIAGRLVCQKVKTITDEYYVNKLKPVV